MTAQQRLRVAIASVLVCATVGALTILFGSQDLGVRLARTADGGIVIQGVNPHSLARVVGLQPGMLVVGLNDVTLIRLPDYIWSQNPDGTTEPEPIGVDPVRPTPQAMEAEQLDSLLAAPIESVTAAQPWHLDHGTVEAGFGVTSVATNGSYGLWQAVWSFGYGLAILAVGLWWLANGRAGNTLRPLALPLAAAVAAPLILEPLVATDAPLAVVLFGILVPLAMWPLADGLAALIEDPRIRRIVILVAAMVAILAVLAGIAVVFSHPNSRGPHVLRWVLAGAIPLLPGLAAAGRSIPPASAARARRRADCSSRRSSPSPVRRRCSPSPALATRCSCRSPSGCSESSSRGGSP